MRAIGIIILTLFLYFNGVFTKISYNGQSRDFEEDLNTTIECIKNLLIEGIPQLPSLIPLKIANFSQDFNSTFLSGNIKVKDLELDGITDFVATHLHDEITVLEDASQRLALQVNLSFTINVNNINLNTEYDADVEILKFISLYGNGTLKANLKNLAISGKILISVDLSYMAIDIEDITLELALEHSKVDITGLLNDEHMSAVISKAISELIVQAFDEYKEEITKMLSDAAKEAISDGANLGKIFEMFEPCLPFQLK